MYKEKLIELIKEVPAIKDDLEELRFGTYILYHSRMIWIYINEKYFIPRYEIYTKWENWTEYIDVNYEKEIEEINDMYFEIIWNPLEERFLMIYCENKWILLQRKSNWLIEWIHKNIEWSYFELQLDNTKDFNNQSEEVFKKLFNVINLW